MSQLILQTATRFMLPLLLLFSIFLLLRGHNEPGGGFAGGLVASSAFALYALAFDVSAARQAMWVDPRWLIGAGLLVALADGCLPLLWGMPLLAHRHFWTTIVLGTLEPIELGTPIFFDLGVYLVVIGVSLTIIWTLAEEERVGEQ